MLLAFDTATHAVTVALHDGSGVVAESTVVDALRHGELLAPGIKRVLDEAGVPPNRLTRVAVGVGPGPFTGLRVGIMTARTMGAVLGISVVGVCTLDVVAAAVTAAGRFLVATDARRKEVYWASYDRDGRRTDGPHVAKPAMVATSDPVAGAGALLYPERFLQPIEPQHPAAADLARLVGDSAVTLLPAEPLYLRRPDAVEATARKRVL